jgi:hypothetical protein
MNATPDPIDDLQLIFSTFDSPLFCAKHESKLAYNTQVNWAMEKGQVKGSISGY